MKPVYDGVVDKNGLPRLYWIDEDRNAVWIPRQYSNQTKYDEEAVAFDQKMALYEFELWWYETLHC